MHLFGTLGTLTFIFGFHPESLPESYRRYLIGRFRDVLHLHGTPLRLELRSGSNPFEGRRNTLTPRQQRHRERLMRHIKGKR